MLLQNHQRCDNNVTKAKAKEEENALIVVVLGGQAPHEVAVAAGPTSGPHGRQLFHHPQERQSFPELTFPVSFFLFLASTLTSSQVTLRVIKSSCTDLAGRAASFQLESAASAVHPRCGAPTTSGQISAFLFQPAHLLIPSLKTLN